MKRERDAGREYAEIWGEAVQANRKLRTILILLAASCVLGVVVLLRIAGAEPPRPIVIRVDEVGGARLRGRHRAGRPARSDDQVLPQPVRPRLPLAPPGHRPGALDPEPPVPLDRTRERRVRARRRRGRERGFTGQARRPPRVSLVSFPRFPPDLPPPRSGFAAGCWLTPRSWAEMNLPLGPRYALGPPATDAIWLPRHDQGGTSR